MRRLPNLFCLAAFGLSAAGVLLILEIIRPFRDLSIDGPIGVISWGIGAVLSCTCFFFRGRSAILSAFALAANVIPLAAFLVLWWIMSHSNFAWH